MILVHARRSLLPRSRQFDILFPCTRQRLCGVLAVGDGGAGGLEDVVEGDDGEEDGGDDEGDGGVGVHFGDCWGWVRVALVVGVGVGWGLTGLSRGFGLGGLEGWKGKGVEMGMGMMWVLVFVFVFVSVYVRGVRSE